MSDDFTESLAGRVLVCDGAMGTMLHAAGMSLDQALPGLNLSNPGLVRAVHDSYIAAGADIIQTNTFGASRFRLALHGSADRTREVNLAGARIALEAKAAAGRPLFVAGSISPVPPAGHRGQVDASQRLEALREQLEALVEGGVELLVFETFGYLREMVEAVEAARGLTEMPIVAQMTFADDGRTFGGETPQEVAAALGDLPVTVVGTNCTLGPQGLLGVLRELSRHTSLPLSAQPNAGVPRMVGGRQFRYTVDADYFARYARRYVEVGAALVGGCCGTTPDHIRAAAQVIAGLPPTPRGRPVPAHPAELGVAEVGAGMAEQLAARRFLVAVEIRPPVGVGVEHATADVAALRGRGASLFCVAPSRSARAQLSPMSLAFHLRQQLNVETVLTATTWDKSIMTLQADLLGAHALGIRSVICQTGSPPLRGDYPNVDGIWDVDSVGLIQLLDGLNHGRDCDGLVLEAATSFCIGARFNPSAQEPEVELARTRAKVEAGAQFLITQPLYELGGLQQMIQALGAGRVPILLCATPLRSFSEAEYLRHEVPDASIPDEVLDVMRRAGDREAETGLELAENLLRSARSLVDGVVLALPDNSPGSFERLLVAATEAPSAALH
ncbi:MAG: bifunctional homocysteine S-methyltransferase/methylenetetrahydrofolate reductase [Candidatus Dormibacteraeota bacterium]|nr:bifunctional homocysteine S-methyltransferase/methylenetetrahydrofolate reductase [Candidatus Dormibacteraeota bacterium]